MSELNKYKIKSNIKVKTRLSIAMAHPSSGH